MYNIFLEFKALTEKDIDDGLCWIGDPCYILHQENLPSSLGKDWHGFCDTLGEEYPTAKSYRYEMGHEGLGVCVSTGCGDGVYPVYIHISDEAGWGKRNCQLLIDFMGNAFGDEENED